MNISDLNPQAILAKLAIVLLLIGGAYFYGYYKGEKTVLAEATSNALAASTKAITEANTRSKEDLLDAIKSQAKKDNSDQVFRALSSKIDQSIEANKAVYKNPDCSILKSDIDLINQAKRGMLKEESK